MIKKIAFIFCVTVLAFSTVPLFSLDNSVESEGITFQWIVHNTYLEVTVTAPTDGWVAVGFKPGTGMKDADIIIGYVEKNGTVVVDDHFGNGVIAHRADVDLGGEDSIITRDGTEENGTTELMFTIPLERSDEYDVRLEKGETLTVMLAYGNRDNLRAKHRVRTKVDITL